MSAQVMYSPKDVLITMAPLAAISIAFIIFALNIIPQGHVLVKSMAVLGGGSGVIGSLGLIVMAVIDIKRR